MTDPFDIDAIKNSIDDRDSARDACVDYCRSALEGFVAAAQQIGTKMVRLSSGHLAAKAAGISKPWPKTGGFMDKEYLYYRIVRSNHSEVWAANDGRGLTVGPSGDRFYLKSRTVSVQAAAHFVAALVDYDIDRAKELFADALRGEPYEGGSL